MRQSEAPITNEVKWQDPFTPQIVLTNLKYSYQARNIENYLKCMADTFIFQPSVEDKTPSSIYSQAFQQVWTKSTEERVTKNIFTTFSKDGSISLALSIIDSIPDPAFPQNEAILYRFYTLDISSSPIGIIKGIARFEMIKNNYNEWIIYYWQDEKIQGYEDWGAIRATYY